MEFLTDIQKDKLANLNQDEDLKDALKKIFLAVVYENGTLKKGIKANPLRNALLGLVQETQSKVITNEQLGEDLRAMFEAIKMIELGFGKVEEFKINEVAEKKPDGNPAI